MRAALRRVAEGGAIVFLVASLTFVLVRLAPGDPFSAALENPAITDAVRAQWRAQAGLDRPVSEQYVRYLVNLAKGDLGPSFSNRRPVADVLADALPNTLLLMGTSLALAFALGLALGVLQASRAGSRTDRVLSSASTVLASLPPFWLASILVLVFAYWVPVLPVAGATDATMYPYMSFAQRVIDRIEHLALPVATLTLLGAPEIARFQRAALLDVLPEDYLRTARAKGLSERRIMVHHALRNALGPAITIFGLSLPTVLGGAVFVESVFGLPGLGLVSLNALSMRDYPVVVATVMIGTILVVVGSCVADLLAAATNPQLRDA